MSQRTDETPEEFRERHKLLMRRRRAAEKRLNSVDDMLLKMRFMTGYDGPRATTGSPLQGAAFFGRK